MRDRYGAGYVAKICAVALGPVTSSIPLLYSIKASIENRPGITWLYFCIHARFSRARMYVIGLCTSHSQLKLIILCGSLVNGFEVIS